MDQDTRITQFEKMAREDPDNALGHFSLGKAYIDARRFPEAAAALQRTVDLDPTFSKAYELLGFAQQQAGDQNAAIQTWTRGAAIADERGDRRPRDAMAQWLRDLSAEVPPFKQDTAPETDPGTGTVVEGFACSRCGRPSGKLDHPPFKGELGQRIFDNVCQPCWREWVTMGTKVINELGLQLASAEHQAVYDQYMLEFLQLEQ